MDNKIRLFAFADGRIRLYHKSRDYYYFFKKLCKHANSMNKSDIISQFDEDYTSVVFGLCKNLHRLSCKHKETI